MIGTLLAASSSAASGVGGRRIITPLISSSSSVSFSSSSAAGDVPSGTCTSRLATTSSHPLRGRFVSRASPVLLLLLQRRRQIDERRRSIRPPLRHGRRSHRLSILRPRCHHRQMDRQSPSGSQRGRTGPPTTRRWREVGCSLGTVDFPLRRCRCRRWRGRKDGGRTARGRQCPREGIGPGSHRPSSRPSFLHRR